MRKLGTLATLCSILFLAVPAVQDAHAGRAFIRHLKRKSFTQKQFENHTAKLDAKMARLRQIGTAYDHTKVLQPQRRAELKRLKAQFTALRKVALSLAKNLHYLDYVELGLPFYDHEEVIAELEGKPYRRRVTY
jgi:hypothetical protein